MGKPKLKSSIKAFFNLRTPGRRTMTTWVCVQQAKTDSFREVFHSFSSINYTSSSSTSSSSAITSSSLYTLPQEDKPNLLQMGPDSFPKGAISSQRFFFSPCSTKSIMEDVNAECEEEIEMGAGDVDVNLDFLKDLCLEREKEEEEMGFGESLRVVMASEDPYVDFRVSMEEMVEAYGLRDWSCLQELLRCYLKLNEKGTHKIIALAFVDLLMNVDSEESKEADGCSENCFPLRLSLEEWQD